jgi:hypothetical protein
LIGLGGAVLASMTATVDASSQAFFRPTLDACGMPLTGLYLFWVRYGWLCMGALALILGIGTPLGMVFSARRGHRVLAALLAVLTPCLAPIPAAIQMERSSSSVGCHPP